MAQLLVIEDETVLAKNIARYFERQGHGVAVAHHGEDGLAMAAQSPPDVVIVDFQLPGLNGLEVIKALRHARPDTRIIMVTGHGSIHLAVEAMKAGSMDLLTKPIALATLDQVVSRALQDRVDRLALDHYRQKEALHSSVNALIGQAQVMQRLRETIQAIATSEPTDHAPVPPVLILGETGTGKELVARACHQAGPRARAAFIDINCAALPAHLMEDELFGHEKGAFTDARQRKVGLIEAADGGTLFLDEIGELDITLQAKLLRVLENQRVRPLGAVRDRQVNIRVVAATNRDLTQAVAEGRFRGDLLYRLGVLQIQLPPLRSRPGDVLLLARHFLQHLSQRYGRETTVLTPDAEQLLNSYPWPGNVRELRNTLERAVLMHPTPVLDAGQLGLPEAQARPKPASVAPNGSTTTLEALERQHLLDALEHTQWNVSLAAKALGISRDTLRYRIQKHQLQRLQGG
jgi:DNA-binding NtrC family response regulator